MVSFWQHFPLVGIERGALNPIKIHLQNNPISNSQSFLFLHICSSIFIAFSFLCKNFVSNGTTQGALLGVKGGKGQKEHQQRQLPPLMSFFTFLLPAGLDWMVELPTGNNIQKDLLAKKKGIGTEWKIGACPWRDVNFKQFSFDGSPLQNLFISLNIGE